MTMHRLPAYWKLPVWMTWLVICIDVEQQRGKDAALWKDVFLSGC